MPSPDAIRHRATLTATLRAFFEVEGYVEVETPLLSREVCVDAHIDPFSLPTASGRRFLQPSPELAMKRLLADAAFAAACPAIWQLGKAFRDNERGSRHQPEFTMCEWYRVGDDHDAQMRFTESLVDAMHRAAVGLDADLPVPSRPYPRVAYWDAAAEAAGRPLKSLPNDELAAAIASALGDDAPARPPDAADCEAWLNLLVSLRIEPMLARHEAAFLVDYPASQAALATTRTDGPVEVAERFELYVRDRSRTMVELANGYNELRDADEARRRFEAANAVRRGRSDLDETERELPLPERFLAANATLPPCSGVALGYDRLVALLLGRDDLQDVAVIDG